MVPTKRLLLSLGLVLAVTGSAPGADHPDSKADCKTCHAVGTSSTAPKVMTKAPGFFAKLFGAEALRGHPSLSCAGSVAADGSLSGCHQPEAGFPGHLAVDLTDRPSDELCGRCHAETREPGKHHPSYRSDKNGDGVLETPIRPAAQQEVFQHLAPANGPAPLRAYPDAIHFVTDSAGKQQLAVVLPLQTVVEVAPETGEKVIEADLMTCTTCHNPHFGYLVGVGSAEELDLNLVAREKGDALLRLRDYDNALCDACH